MKDSVKVEMNLSKSDVINAEKLLTAMKTNRKVEVVQNSLSIVAGINKLLKEGNELILRQKDGTTEKITIPLLS